MPLETTLDARHPVGMEETTCRRPVEQRYGVTEASSAVLGTLGFADTLDGRADATALSPIPEAG